MFGLFPLAERQKDDETESVAVQEQGIGRIKGRSNCNV